MRMPCAKATPVALSVYTTKSTFVTAVNTNPAPAVLQVGIPGTPPIKAYDADVLEFQISKVAVCNGLAHPILAAGA